VYEDMPQRCRGTLRSEGNAAFNAVAGELAMAKRDGNMKVMRQEKKI
jgi:hypothetical protein